IGFWHSGQRKCMDRTNSCDRRSPLDRLPARETLPQVRGEVMRPRHYVCAPAFANRQLPKPLRIMRFHCDVARMGLASNFLRRLAEPLSDFVPERTSETRKKRDRESLFGWPLKRFPTPLLLLLQIVGGTDAVHRLARFHHGGDREADEDGD